jgi:hypothetical protein
VDRRFRIWFTDPRRNHLSWDPWSSRASTRCERYHGILLLFSSRWSLLTPVIGSLTACFWRLRRWPFQQPRNATKSVGYIVWHMNSLAFWISRVFSLTEKPLILKVHWRSTNVSRNRGSLSITARSSPV